MDEERAEALAAFFTALSDPTRLRLMGLMLKGPVAVSTLSEETGDSQPKVSRHLAYLRGAGLVNTEREGKNIFYQIDWPQDRSQADIIRLSLGEAAVQMARAAEPPADIYAQADTSSVSGESEPSRELEIYLL